MELQNPKDAFVNLGKQEKYAYTHSMMAGLVEAEVDTIANLANAVALLKEVFDWWWIGFYRIKDNQLVLGPFQGPVACTRIEKGKGVCGTCWQQQATQIVGNVHEIENHIACSPFTNSEIVVPILYQGVMVGVLDADSQHLHHFDATDALELEKLCQSFGKLLVNLT